MVEGMMVVEEADGVRTHHHTHRTTHNRMRPFNNVVQCQLKCFGGGLTQSIALYPGCTNRVLVVVARWLRHQRSMHLV
jgi:hypothetical protein